jgi:hypothetical protein
MTTDLRKRTPEGMHAGPQQQARRGFSRAVRFQMGLAISGAEAKCP